jgi:hypothetical protein
MLRDFRQYADDERYLFGIVTKRFHKQGWLNAFDIMAIARWKAERARIHVARRLVSRGAASVEGGAKSFTMALNRGRNNRERFNLVIGKWGFRLPMGSAILSVCFPEASVFTIFESAVS